MDQPNDSTTPTRVLLLKQPRTVDIGLARRYFGAVEALAREARTTRDSRVLIAALKVLAIQQDTIDQLLGRRTGA